MRSSTVILFAPIVLLACASDPPATQQDAAADAKPDTSTVTDAAADSAKDAIADASVDAPLEAGDCSQLSGNACQSCCRTQFAAGLAKFKTIVVSCVCNSSCQATCANGICATDPKVDTQACSNCIAGDAGGCASTLSACQNDKDCLDFAGCSKDCN